MRMIAALLATLLAALLVAMVLAPPAARADALDDAVDYANALRNAGCGGRPGVDERLARDVRLDEAAARVAGGADLKAATAASGYRIRRVARIRLENYSGADVAGILESQFCDIVADPELVDIGMHMTGGETWLVLAVPLALGAGTSTAGAADRLFAGINDARATGRRCGILKKLDAAPPLQRSAALDMAAAAHARDIAARGALGHEGADGSTAAERAERAGYRWTTVGENVAAGQTEAADVVDTWLDSPGHCRNLMDARFSDTGIAVAVNESDDKVIYWVQVYGAPE